MGNAAEDADADDFIEGAVLASSFLLEDAEALQCGRQVLDLGLTRHDLVLVAETRLLRSVSERAVHAHPGLDAVNGIDVALVGEAVELVAGAGTDIQDGTMALRQKWFESRRRFPCTNDAADSPDFGEDFLLEAGEVTGEQNWMLHGGDQIACDAR